MPIYGVVMDQAVSMANLGANTLITGYKPGEFLYSCSAIILVNPGSGSAGLFHFPSGDIYNDIGSRIVLADLIRDIAPTEAWVCYGTVNYFRPNKPPLEPSDLGQTISLIQWLQGQLGFAVQYAAATSGSAAVNIAGGAAQITDASNFAGNATDLEPYGAGNYAAGFKVYWKRNNLTQVVLGRHRSPAI